MKTIAGLLGGGSDAKQKMMRIYNFERDIAIVFSSFDFNQLWTQLDAIA